MNVTVSAPEPPVIETVASLTLNAFAPFAKTIVSAPVFPVTLAAVVNADVKVMASTPVLPAIEIPVVSVTLNVFPDAEDKVIKSVLPPLRGVRLNLNLNLKISL